MQLVDYEQYIINHNSAYSSKSRDYVGWSGVLWE